LRYQKFSFTDGSSIRPFGVESPANFSRINNSIERWLEETILLPLRLNLWCLRIVFYMGAERMYRDNWLILAVCCIFLFGCASWQKANTDKSKLAPTSSAAKAATRSVKSADGLINGEIVGTPAPGSKFDKLQIGMTLEQVEHLIGRPNDTDSRITGNLYQPFYFGGDTQRTEAFYKDEGQLTFSNVHPDSTADTLIRIMVEPDATGNR
jgi:hypothetical protein